MKIKCVSSIFDKYDTFILDQWGVLHNGGNAFIGAVEVLAMLKKLSKKVIILSNSGKKRDDSYHRLEASGISRDLYYDVMTSGDHMRYNFIKSNLCNKLGKKAFLLPWNKDTSVLEDLQIESCEVSEADFILCCGVDRGAVSAYREDLEIALKRGLSLVVSNPDLVAMFPDGNLYTCPGAIAKYYEDIGGTVYWYGKPKQEIYELCKQEFGNWNNAVAVGDSLSHDIQGANNANIDSLFVYTGIHSVELKTISLEDLFLKYRVRPTHIIDYFSN